MSRHDDNKGLIFVISGPSGSGKTTLANSLLEDIRLRKFLRRSISFTTRRKRSGEKEAKDYFFVTKKTFREKLKDKRILEWTKYLGYFYGTSKDFVDEQINQGKGIILCLDFKGARNIKLLYPANTVTIFIMPLSIETLHQRIKQRCSKTKKEEIQQRLKLAKKELLHSRKYDYRVENEKLKLALRELKSIIIKEMRGKIRQEHADGVY